MSESSKKMTAVCDRQVADDPVQVQRRELSAMLRSAHLANVDLSVDAGWWTLRLPMTGMSAGATDLGDVVTAAIGSLRDWAAHQATINPVGWLVRYSTDAELAAWMGLPAPDAA